MKTIGMFDAKTRFSEIVKRVKQTGQPVRITNRGEELVDITPIPARAVGRRTPKQAFTELSKLRHELPKTSSAEIRAQIEEGRR